jgi:hypothetical protein
VRHELRAVAAALELGVPGCVKNGGKKNENYSVSVHEADLGFGYKANLPPYNHPL